MGPCNGCENLDFWGHMVPLVPLVPLVSLGPVEKVGVERSVASSFHVTVPTGTKHKKIHELPSGWPVWFALAWMLACVEAFDAVVCKRDMRALTAQ